MDQCILMKMTVDLSTLILLPVSGDAVQVPLASQMHAVDLHLLLNAVPRHLSLRSHNGSGVGDSALFGDLHRHPGNRSDALLLLCGWSHLAPFEGLLINLHS